MRVTVAPLSPARIRACLPDLAALRITVFRDWPYLYEGTAEYEEAYLAPYAESASALVVGAWDGDRLVGAATATPMEDHAAAFAEPLAEAGIAPREVYYFGESVLLAAYRGQGIGHAFFDAREARARALGRRLACFCAVIRPDDHPLRPADYRPLDPFWRRRGYAPLPGAEARFAWRDVGDREESEKRMRVWLRDLETQT
jgi:GNAT superfamily N-acetyltransferase